VRRVGRGDAGAGVAGVIDGRLLRWAVTWRRRMGRAVSLGAGDVAALSMASVGSGEIDEQAPAWPNYGHSLGARGQQGRPRVVDGGGGERERDDGHKCVTW